jgi:hypothetical protein
MILSSESKLNPKAEVAAVLVDAFDVAAVESVAETGFICISMISFGRSHVFISVHADLAADQAVAGKRCGDAVPQADAVLLLEIAEPRGDPKAMFDSLDGYPRTQGRAVLREESRQQCFEAGAKRGGPDCGGHIAAALRSPSCYEFSRR